MSMLERAKKWCDRFYDVHPAIAALWIIGWAAASCGCAESSQESPKIVTAEVGSDADVDAVDPPPQAKPDPGNGGQAFPNLNGWNDDFSAENGLTKLDFFAANAPPRLYRDGTAFTAEEDAELESKWRYLYAKEMLRERDKQ